MNKLTTFFVDSLGLRVAIASLLRTGMVLSLAALGCSQRAVPPEDRFSIVYGIGSVVVTTSDVLRYEWPAHRLWLTPEKHRELLAHNGETCSINVGDQQIYTAEVVSPVMSYTRHGIVLTDPIDAPESTSEAPVQIQVGYFSSVPVTGRDDRFDPRLQRALTRSGLLAPPHFSTLTPKSRNQSPLPSWPAA